ncbi:hypothetical protein Ancab_029352 [Ancistrocladus abbreviatus]
MAATTSRTKSNTLQRSHSPSGRFCSSSISSSSSSSFSSQCSSIFQRSSSTTRVNLHTNSSPSTSSPSTSTVRFSVDTRPTSPGRSISVNQIVNKQGNRLSSTSSQKKTCMCSPTTHPGSFRCSLHKNLDSKRKHETVSSYHRLNMRRSAMTNSLVRIGTVEGEWVKRALATLIRPCAHQQRRRGDFQPRPSRLSIMLNAEDL